MAAEDLRGLVKAILSPPETSLEIPSVRTEPHIPVPAAFSDLWGPVVIASPCAVSVLPPPNSPSLGELQLFSSQCSEPQKLLHIAQELLHTEETYVKRLHLLDQVTLPAWSLALSTSRVSMGSFRGKLYILALARPCSWNMLVMNTTTWTYLSLLQKFLVFAFTTFGSGAKVLSSHLGGFSSWQLNYLSR